MNSGCVGYFVKKAKVVAISDFLNSRLFVFGSELRIYSHLLFSSVTAVQEVLQ